MNVDYKDLYSTARMLVDIHGREAESFAIEVIDGLHLQNDLSILVIWQGILKAVIEIQSNSGNAIQ